MKFSLILNSRERTGLLDNFLQSIKDTADDIENIEVIIGIDKDDLSSLTKLDYFYDKYSFIKFAVIEPTTSNLNHNFSLIYPNTSGKYIMIANDDIVFQNKGWDKEAFDSLEKYLFDKQDGIVYGQTSDNSVDRSGEYSSFPIVTRNAIELLGYVMNPKFVSHGADVELYRIFKTVNRICPVNIQIDHIYHNSLDKINNPDKIQQIIREKRNLNEIDCFSSDITLDVACLNAEINKHNSKEIGTNKLAVIYNICGISGREDLKYYCHVLQSIFNQHKNDTDFLVAISACRVKKEILNALKQYFPSLFIVDIWDVVPVNVSFNLTVQKIVERFGKFDGYLYLDYGIHLGSNSNLLNELHSKFISGPYGMLSTRTDNDNGYHLWYGVGKFHGDESENYKLFENGDFIVPIGKCVNLHAQIFSHKLYEAYNQKLMPDIFAAYCTESIFSFLNAALSLKWIVTKDHILHHEQLPLNGASGFGCGYDGLDRMFADTTPVIERIKPGIQYGMGYDESRGLVMHDTSQYNNEGFCINDKLKEYIRDYMFLSKDKFDYNNIRYNVYE